MQTLSHISSGRALVSSGRPPSHPERKAQPTIIHVLHLCSYSLSAVFPRLPKCWHFIMMGWSSELTKQPGNGEENGDVGVRRRRKLYPSLNEISLLFYYDDQSMPNETEKNSLDCGRNNFYITIAIMYICNSISGSYYFLYCSPSCTVTEVVYRNACSCPYSDPMRLSESHRAARM